MILLTGGNGLIGSFIARKLLLENEPFKVLIRKNANLSLLKDIKFKLNFIEGDILDIASLENAFEGITEVIHCAAVVSFGEVSVDLMFKINVEGTKNMVNAALHFNVKRFCHLSSVAAIGRDPKALKIDESSKWIESDLNSQYAISKYLGELEVWRGIEEGLNAIMLCPTIVMGPGNWNLSSTKLFKNIYEGMKFYPSGSTNLVDVRDVADAAYLALKSNISAERYIIHAENVSYKDFFSKIAIGFDKNPPTIRLTKNIILPFYYVLKILAPFYLKKRFINKETIVISNSHFEYSNSKFIKAFNFKYRDISETINWACEGLLKRMK
jgi:dihydroflavonol-4-reductase